MTIVHLMRHGQVDNPKGVLYERLPGFHLSELGLAMVEMTSQFMVDRPLAHLRCSPLERTRESMAPTAALFPELPVQLDDAVIEAGNVFAGQVMGSTGAAAKQPKNWRYLINPFRPSWGEAYRAIADRMAAAVRQAAAAAAGGEALIVSHQLPIWVTRLASEGRHLWHDPRRRQCTLASVTTFVVEDDRIIWRDYVEPARSLLPDAGRVGF
ncbi:MAG: histidine phosphatase family protein [Propionibacteriaceae bacterium]|jgi:broad specificity phosphatase PhoE|nr:histidine phosphatase family protein [Propionibacteriaceae bacterium]